MRTYLKVCIVMKMLSLTILLHKALPMYMCSFDICDQNLQLGFWCCERGSY